MTNINDHISTLRKKLVWIMQESGIGEAQIPDDLIYHYTTAAGLKGILEGRHIFATNANYLNDLSERWYGEDAADRFLRERLEIERMPLLEGTQDIFDNGPEGLKSKLYSELISKIGKPFHVIWNAVSAMELWPRKDYYITSFCQSGDLLSQWRGYANRGGGYAIGLSVGASRIRTEEGKFGALRVVYDSDEQRKILAALLAEVISSVNACDCHDMRSEECKAIVNKHALILVGFYKMIGPRLKDAAFAEENEWRFITQLDLGSVDTVHFRDANGLLIPFIKLPINREGISVRRIVCGPTLHPQLARQSAGMLVRQMKFENVDIDNSRIPLSPS